MTFRRLLAIVRYHASPPKPKQWEAQARLILYSTAHRRVMAVPINRPDEDRLRPAAIRKVVLPDAVGE